LIEHEHRVEAADRWSGHDGLTGAGAQGMTMGHRRAAGPSRLPLWCGIVPRNRPMLDRRARWSAGRRTAGQPWRSCEDMLGRAAFAASRQPGSHRPPGGDPAVGLMATAVCILGHRVEAGDRLELPQPLDRAAADRSLA